MVKIEITLKQVQNIIRKLPGRDKLKLFRNLEQEAWAVRFQKLRSRLRNKARIHKISQRDIDQAVEEARQEVYARRGH